MKTLKIDKTIIYLFASLVIVCILFFPTLKRGWLIYDERIIYDNIYFTTPLYFSELFEIVKKFGLNFNVISSNPIYSTNFLVRTSPMGQILGMVIGYITKKEPFLWHALTLVLHLMNTCLVFYILKVALNNKQNTNTNYIISVLTLLFATHPVIVEPVLLATNFGATFSYIFFFAFLLDFLLNRNKNKLLRMIFIPFAFLIPMLTNEYIVTLPFVFFTLSMFLNSKNYPLKDSLVRSFKETIPYFIGLLIYTVYFLFFTDYSLTTVYNYNKLIVLFERVFWLAPQIFFHNIKLMFFPKILTIDQSLFVKLGGKLLDPYSIFCIFFFMFWLLVPLFLFLKKRLQCLFLISWGVFFAMLPFLHILVPSYALSAERYLYCPLGVFITGLAFLIKEIKLSLKPVIVLLTIVLIVFFLRAGVYAKSWSNNYTFIETAYDASQDSLFKAQKLLQLGDAIKVYEKNEDKAKPYFFKSVDLLEKAKEETTKKLNELCVSPMIVKAYGLDYESRLLQIAFLEAKLRCGEFYEPAKIGINILKPYIDKAYANNPDFIQFLVNLLIIDKQYEKAESILQKAYTIYPNLPIILLSLFEYNMKFKKDEIKAERYLLEGLKYSPYDISLLYYAFLFYSNSNDLHKRVKYAYLYGLRTQSKLAYEEALINSQDLNDVELALKIKKKLLKIEPGDL